MWSNESSESEFQLNGDEQATLLHLAKWSIDWGLTTGQMLQLHVDDYSSMLRSIRAAFVTLQLEGQLRGCMGSLKATEMLVASVVRNSTAAAFRDPRFSPVSRDEYDRLDIHISVLSPPEPLEALTEADLLNQIRPGVDGLILYEGSRRGTLLPSVWSMLPEPEIFLSHLKRKAGLPTDYWSPTVQIERYTVVSIEQ